MKTILVLSSHPDFAETIRASLNPEQYRVVHRLRVEEAEPLLTHGLAAACILDVDLMGVEGVWVIERLRRRDAKTPIIAYTASSPVRVGGGSLFARRHPCADQARPAPAVEFLAGTPVEHARHRPAPLPLRRRRPWRLSAPPKRPPPAASSTRRRRSTCCAIFRPSSPIRWTPRRC